MPSNEIWRTVNHAVFGKHYEVSTHGRVRRTTKATNTKPGKLLRPHIHDYPYVDLYAGGRGVPRKRFSVHALVARAFLPNPRHLPQVNHIDSNKCNNCVENLEWCSQTHNSRHAVSAGVGNTMRLDADDVRAIRASLSRGGLGSHIAREYGVYPSTIYHIRDGKTWRYVK